MSNNSLRAHKRADALKWILTAIAFLLVAVTLIGLCLQVFGKGKQKPSEWFKKEEEQVQPEAGAGAGILTPQEPEASAAMPMRLNVQKLSTEELAVSPMAASADSAFTLTVTYPEEGVMYKEVDYSIAWQNGGSGKWGNGKTVTQYATVAATADGALTATVTCLQAFGEPIIVTVTNRANPSCKATAQLDYARRVTGLSVKLSDGKTTVTAAEGTNLGGGYVAMATTTGSKGSSSIEYSFTYSTVYTVEDSFSVTKATSSKGPFWDKLKTYAATTSYYQDTKIKAAFEGIGTFLSPIDFNVDLTYFDQMGNMFSSFRAVCQDSASGGSRDKMLAIFAGYLNSDSDNWRDALIVYDVTVTGTYSSYTAKMNLGISSSAFGTVPKQMTVDSNHVF